MNMERESTIEVKILFLIYEQRRIWSSLRTDFLGVVGSFAPINYCKI